MQTNKFLNLWNLDANGLAIDKYISHAISSLIVFDR